MNRLDRLLSRVFVTTLLSFFLLLWYIFQTLSLNTFGVEFSQHIFYATPGIDPGWIFSPISHELDNWAHVTTNVLILLFIGWYIEPQLPTKLYLSVFFSLTFLSIFLTILLVHFMPNQQWMVAGASGGIFGLYTYYSTILYLNGFSLTQLWNQNRTILIPVILTISFLIITVYQLIIDHSGSALIHFIGFCLGAISAFDQTPQLSMISN